jgi:hypothetical protein
MKLLRESYKELDMLWWDCTPNEYVEALNATLNYLRSAANEAQEMNMKKSVVKANKTRKGLKQFSVGDVVMVFFHDRAGKVDTFWKAAFKVVAVIQPNVYSLQHAFRPSEMYTVHGERMLPFDITRVNATVAARLPANLAKEYVLEKILAHRVRKDGIVEVLCKWLGFEDIENTWSLASYFRTNPVLKDYLATNADAKALVYPKRR